MNFKFEKGISWWLNPFCAFMLVSFLWSMVYAVLNKFSGISRVKLDKYDELSFALAGGAALVVTLLTRKKGAESAVTDKFVLIIAVSVCSGLIILGLIGFMQRI